MVLTITCDIEPMTLNMAYPSSKKGGRFLSKEGKVFKDYVYFKTIEALSKNEQFPIKNNIEFYTSMEIFFYSPKFFTKNGKISKNKPDTSNCIKLAEDAVFEALGIDDYLNIDFDGVRFRYSETPKIIIILRVHDVGKLNNNVDAILR